ncbi:ELMO domain-containing protein B [Wickerhamiella sorbophila]|uniref:ELMO domain-containing protein B n=1 Tax=Wickerhamiella sorbophila TaxID=45607 RepID=A0A2T0FKY1_9ASCO|nr:ELMO domain-containing protein B [Wickerhamiella sorbophila]PRT55635.1 ELMO domain-containing protein B [Wickerhamiella sorbophila]
MVQKAAVSAWTALAVVLGYFGSNPHHLARWSIELRSRKWLLTAALLKHSYMWVAIVHRALHMRGPSHRYDKVASIVWNEDLSQALDYLASKSHEPVHWDESTSSRLATVYSGLFEPEKHLDPSKLGNAGCDWVKLGFQGKDPTTDFRGTGALGLDQFEAFCTHPHAKQIFIESGSAPGSTAVAFDTPWYPVALVSIRLTHFLVRKMMDDPVCMALIWESASCTHTTFPQELATMHTRLMLDFHEAWQNAVERKEITNYHQNEAFIKSFEQKTDKIIKGPDTPVWK